MSARVALSSRLSPSLLVTFYFLRYIFRPSPNLVINVSLPQWYGAKKDLIDNRALRDVVNAWFKTSQMRVDRRDLEMEERSIGAGSVKSVCKGTLRMHGKTVTFAILKMRSGSFDEEAKTLLKLGLIGTGYPAWRVFSGSVKTNDGKLLLITEFAEFGSLSDAFETMKGQMTSAHKLMIMQEVCQGMEYLAEMKLVHCDLAARNVLNHC